MLGAVSLFAFRLLIERANVRRKPRARYLVVVFTLGLRILLGVVIALALTQFVLRQRVRRLIAQEHARPARTKPEAPIERPLYNRTNRYFTSHDLMQMIASLDRGSRERLVARVDDLGALYADLSAVYQAAKVEKGIPLINRSIDVGG